MWNCSCIRFNLAREISYVILINLAGIERPFIVQWCSGGTALSLSFLFRSRDTAGGGDFPVMGSYLTVRGTS